VRKHARPTRVEVTLEYLADEITLTIEDFSAAPAVQSEPPATPPGSGYGLTGMRERAELLGGTLDAAPTETGFLVRLRVPTGDSSP
jgi:signal transduction histidine kinase